MCRPLFVACLLLLPCGLAAAAEALLPQGSAYQTPDAWRQPVAPVRIADHTWAIGTASITALLVKTDAGAIAAIKRATGAQVLNSAESAVLMANGGSNDIHFGDDILYPPVQTDRVLHDGEVVVLGTMRLTAHFIPGHTPGSTIMVVSSGTARALLLGDVVHCPVELLDEEWAGMGDVDPELAKRTRNAMARELEGTDVPVAAAHFPGLQFGKLLVANGKRQWVIE